MAAPPPAEKPFLVVIDPGHGGNDYGASIKGPNGKAWTEKDLTLLLSQVVSNELRTRKIQTVLTRREDLDVSLTERTAIANRLGANLFISIHMNSMPKSAGPAEGIETYILNTSTDQSSKRLADLENSVLEGSALKEKMGSNDVALILKDLTLDANLSRSKEIACRIQDRIVTATSQLKDVRKDTRRNRGVKQALFYVLLGADMPSVLIEAGFLHNEKDRAQVLNPGPRLVLAKAIAQAIVEFKSRTGINNCIVH